MGNPDEQTEFLIGLVAPVGVDLSHIQTMLKGYLKQFNYECNHIRLSDFIRGLGTPINESTEYERINSLMTAGNEARQKAGRNDFIASLGILGVYKKRKGKPLVKCAHVFDSVKHPDEVQTLRRIYGDGFYLIGIASSRSNRLNYLIKLKGMTEEEAGSLISRDESEEFDFGQHMRNAFHLADFFVNIDAPKASDQLARVLDLIFGNPCLTPTRDEYAMFMAYAASLRSGDLSRQVGAVVTSPCNEIISTGANDVPCSNGGLYWADPEHEDKDNRDYKLLGYDANEKKRDEIAIEIMKKINKGKASQEELLRKGRKILKDTGVFDITEYGRAVHAEMEAIICCARSGVSPRGGTLYTTTFPCHNCARHIVAAGISRVVFVEPYPKSLAPELHHDSVFLANEDDIKQANSKVKFEPFVGVGPRHFLDLFSMMLSSGRTITRKEDGKRVLWKRNKASLRVPLSPLSYLEKETSLVADIKEKEYLFKGKHKNG